LGLKGKDQDHRKPCEHRISKINEGNLPNFLTTGLPAPGDVPIRCLGQKVKGQGHSKRSDDDSHRVPSSC